MASSLLAHYVVMLDSQVLAMTVWPTAELIKAPRNSTWILWSGPRNKQTLAKLVLTSFFKNPKLL